MVQASWRQEILLIIIFYPQRIIRPGRLCHRNSLLFQGFLKPVRCNPLQVRWMLHLDYIINQFSNVKVNKMKPVIRNILRMSVYQLKFMNSVPASAVCNEAVKLAVKKGFRGLKGFVNPGCWAPQSRFLPPNKISSRRRESMEAAAAAT